MKLAATVLLLVTVSLSEGAPELPHKTSLKQRSIFDMFSSLIPPLLTAPGPAPPAPSSINIVGPKNKAPCPESNDLKENSLKKRFIWDWIFPTPKSENHSSFLGTFKPSMGINGKQGSESGTDQNGKDKEKKNPKQ